VATKKGRFELSDGGTLFLDEIGELSPLLQVKLLRVLQEKKFERVGGLRQVVVNFRLITATNKQLKKEVQRGRFREDLYYRLNVVHIDLPPLRRRMEDLRLLVDHFIDKYADERRMGVPVKGIEREVEQIFYRYNWPGNVRELENAIERAMVLCPDDTIRVSDLPRDFRDSLSGETQLENIPMDAKLFQTLASIEKKMILRALKNCNNVQTEAAQLLGIGKSGFNKKLKKFDIFLD